MDLHRRAPAHHRIRRQRSPRGVGLLGVTAAAVMLLAGCGNSADPSTWEEAEANAFADSETGEVFDSAVEYNFMYACRLANAADGGGDLTPEEARVVCACAFEGLRGALSLQEFRDLDRALRNDPNPSDLDDAPEDSWDDVAESILDDCARRVDA